MSINWELKYQLHVLHRDMFAPCLVATIFNGHVAKYHATINRILESKRFRLVADGGTANRSWTRNWNILISCVFFLVYMCLVLSYFCVIIGHLWKSSFARSWLWCGQTMWVKRGRNDAQTIHASCAPQMVRIEVKDINATAEGMRSNWGRWGERGKGLNVSSWWTVRPRLRGCFNSPGRRARRRQPLIWLLGVPDFHGGCICGRTMWLYADVYVVSV